LVNTEVDLSCHPASGTLRPYFNQDHPVQARNRIWDRPNPARDQPNAKMLW